MSNDRVDPWLEQIKDSFNIVEQLLNKQLNSELIIAYMHMYPEYSLTFDQTKNELEKAKHKALKRLDGLKNAYKQVDTDTP